ncbi:MAG: DNA polymerase III subunit chi [Azonexus sp.]|nr:DNA polymerase III subunit chi [Betaproteobacteria bacterium]MBK8917280.1 DNA polymerase III subunit chi [Betaproteobacteria bacterium]MBP6035043.1 DNA polymerase III subunit chi [Azonexus sp.]MBP6905979.1 DNA polymerase III subunit chi [Azonexus sp.]
MTQVFFYHGARDKLAAACSLIGKAWGQRKPVLVFAPQPGQADEVDRLLWSQTALSFIPHCRADSPLAAETPILITTALDAPPQDERLLNLGPEVPPNFSRFASLIEVVGQEDEDRNAARERVRFYKERGYAIQYFDLSAS